jgi:ethanolamine utilization protein EutQ (cupin superfamily)
VEECRVDFDSLEWQTPLPGARFKVYRRDGRRLRLVEFTKDFVEPEWCTKGHIGYVVEGEMAIDFDGHIVPYSTGDGIFIPAGQGSKHMVKVLTDVVRLIVIEDV